MRCFSSLICEVGTFFGGDSKILHDAKCGIDFQLWRREQRYPWSRIANGIGIGIGIGIG